MKFRKEDLDYSNLAKKQLKFCIERDKHSLAKINDIIADILLNGYGGGFHPKMLSGKLKKFCRKDVDDKNRVVFKIEDGKIYIAQVMGHYDDH
jgi:toxin YoeB